METHEGTKPWDYKLFLALLKEKATHQHIIPVIIKNDFEVTCGSLNVHY
jgi:hypothetical protein